MDKRHFWKMQITQKVRKTPENQWFSGVFELRGKDLNQRPPGYECVINTTISFVACVNFLFCVVLACFCNSFVQPFLFSAFCRRIDGQIMDKVVGFRFQNSDFISAQIVQNSCVFAFNVWMQNVICDFAALRVFACQVSGTDRTIWCFSESVELRECQSGVTVCITQPIWALRLPIPLYMSLFHCCTDAFGYILKEIPL